MELTMFKLLVLLLPLGLVSATPDGSDYGDDYGDGYGGGYGYPPPKCSVATSYYPYTTVVASTYTTKSDKYYPTSSCSYYSTFSPVYYTTTESKTYTTSKASTYSSCKTKPTKSSKSTKPTYPPSSSTYYPPSSTYYPPSSTYYPPSTTDYYPPQPTGYKLEKRTGCDAEPDHCPNPYKYEYSSCPCFPEKGVCKPKNYYDYEDDDEEDYQSEGYGKDGKGKGGKGKKGKDEDDDSYDGDYEEKLKYKCQKKCDGYGDKCGSCVSVVKKGKKKGRCYYYKEKAPKSRECEDGYDSEDEKKGKGVKGWYKHGVCYY